MVLPGTKGTAVPDAVRFQKWNSQNKRVKFNARTYAPAARELGPQAHGFRAELSDRSRSERTSRRLLRDRRDCAGEKSQHPEMPTHASAPTGITAPAHPLLAALEAHNELLTLSAVLDPHTKTGADENVVYAALLAQILGPVRSGRSRKIPAGRKKGLKTG